MDYEQIYNNPIPFITIFNGILILVILGFALFFEYVVTDRSIKGRIFSFFKSLIGFSTVSCALVSILVSVIGMAVYFTVFYFDSEAAERNILKKEGFQVESLSLTDACDFIEKSYLNKTECNIYEVFKKINPEVNESNVLNGYTQQYFIISFDEKNEPHIKTELNVNLGKAN